MCSVKAKLFDEVQPQRRAEVVKAVAMRLASARVGPDELAGTIRYVHWTRDVKCAREVLRRFSRGRRYFGRSLSLKRQQAAIEREFFAILSVCRDVDDLMVLGMQVAQLIPYYAQQSEKDIAMEKVR
ncbi:MAG TPA: hypothetical protein VM163_12390 [bacterium]|nr:hypothetical protein [bacterium]